MLFSYNIVICVAYDVIFVQHSYFYDFIYGFSYFSTTEHVWVDQGCFWHCIRHDKCRLLWQAFDIYQGYTFRFIKAVSDTVLDMINAVYYDKPLIFIRAIRLGLSRLFLTLYYTWQMPFIMTSLWFLFLWRSYTLYQMPFKLMLFLQCLNSLPSLEELYVAWNQLEKLPDTCSCIKVNTSIMKSKHDTSVEVNNWYNTTKDFTFTHNYSIILGNISITIIYTSIYI